MQYAFYRVLNFINSARYDEDGQGLVEYALIIALVSVALIAALKLLAVNINGVFTAIDTALTGA